MFIVQDYVRVLGGDDVNARDRWCFSYNHDVEHPYYAPRSGFVRTKMKHQGMVVLVGDGGKTRLTWLVNMDFGGLVPSSFISSLLVGLMVYPTSVVEDVKAFLQTPEIGTHKADIGKISDTTSSLSASTIPDTVVELKARVKRDISKISGLEAQAKRDAAKIAQLEEELSTMRRRAARRGHADADADEDE